MAIFVSKSSHCKKKNFFFLLLLFRKLIFNQQNHMFTLNPTYLHQSSTFILAFVHCLSPTCILYLCSFPLSPFSIAFVHCPSLPCILACVHWSPKRHTLHTPTPRPRFIDSATDIHKLDVNNPKVHLGLESMQIRSFASEYIQYYTASSALYSLRCMMD